MEKETNNSEIIKKYTREINTLLENDGLLTHKELIKIHEKYELNKDDLDKVEDIAIKFYEKAMSDYDFGNWDSALSNIELAFKKSPFNIEILILYCKILIENSKFSDTNQLQVLESVLSRLQQIDKKEYIKLKKVLKTNKKRGFNKLFLLFLLILFIPIFFILKPHTTKQKILSNPQYIPEKKPINGEIPITIQNKFHPSNLKIKIIKSKLESSNTNFLFNLQFLISSDKENILEVKGDIIWLDKNSSIIYSEPFTAGDNKEFYINELIPVTYTKSSLRGEPDLYDVIIKINEITSLPGKERSGLKEIEYTLPSGIFRKLSFKQGEFNLTEGVVSKYLSFTIIITNDDNKDINNLSCNIVWIDDYDIIQTSNSLDLITNNDIKLEPNESRIIHKTIELNDDITQDYKLEVVKIK